MSAVKTKEELELELIQLNKKYNELKNTLDNYSVFSEKNSIKSISDDENVVLFNNLLIELLKSDNIDNLYKCIGSTLKKLLPDTIILLNSVNERIDETTLEIVEGLESKFLKKCMSIIGFNPVGRKFKLLPKYKELFSTGYLRQFEGGLADFATTEFPSAIAKTLEYLIGIDKIYTIGLKSNGEIIASIHLITFNRAEIKNKIFIESYLSVAGLIIQKLMAETSSSEDRRMLDNIINSIPQSVFWKDSDGYFMGCNQQFANAVGLTSPSEIVGKTD